MERDSLEWEAYRDLTTAKKLLAKIEGQRGYEGYRELRDDYGLDAEGALQTAPKTEGGQHLYSCLGMLYDAEQLMKSTVNNFEYVQQLLKVVEIYNGEEIKSTENLGEKTKILFVNPSLDDLIVPNDNYVPSTVLTEETLAIPNELEAAQGSLKWGISCIPRILAVLQ